MNQKSHRIGIDLTSGPILQTLLVYAVPFILTNIIQQLYSIIDLAVIGHYMGSVGTVGVSVGGEMADLLLPVATAFASAGQIYIAQLVGAKKREDISEAIGTLFSVMLLISICCTVFIFFFHVPILRLLKCPDEAFSQATSYMLIVAFGTVFVFGYNAVCGILRGMGESKRPLYFVSIAAAINIVTDLLFVAVFKMEAAGTALATIISQIGSFAAALAFLYKKRDLLNFEFKLSYFRVREKPLKVILKLGVPTLVKSMLIHYSMLWVNVNINAYGLVVSATNSIGNKIQKLLNCFTTGVEAAAGSIIAQNLGAKKHERAKGTLLTTLAFTLAIAAVCAFLSLSIPKFLFGLFTTDEAVIGLGVTYLRIMSIAFFVSAFTGTFQAMVTGSGFASLGFLIGILDGVICRIGFSLLFLYVFQAGAASYFWGTALSRTIPGIICLAYFLSGKWRTRKLLTE